MRMQWSLNIDSLSPLCPALYDLEIPSNRSSLLIVHQSSLLVANPGVSSSSSRVDPHDMLETKIVSQRNINHFDCHSNELPALIADVGFVTAGANIIVIRQIYIKAQLLSYGSESGGFAESLSIARIGAVYWADFESRWHEA